MKRLLSICIILAVVFSLAGCNLIPNKDHGKTNDAAQNSDNADPGINETDPLIEETQGEATEPEADDGSIRMDPDTQYKINLFLSNFAEAQIDQYPCCDYHKLKFVLAHCQINGVGDLDYADNHVQFSKATAESVLNTYTGTMITENSDDNQYEDCTGSGAVITFSENSYACSADTGEFSVYTAVADRMYENDDGTYTVYYHVYVLDSDFSSYDYSAIYKYTPDEAIYDWNLSAVYEAEAVVRDYVRSNGQESYQLISLKPVE